MADYTSRTLPPKPPKSPDTSFGDDQDVQRKRIFARDALLEAEQAERVARSARLRANKQVKSYLDAVEALHGTLLDEL